MWSEIAHRHGGKQNTAASAEGDPVTQSTVKPIRLFVSAVFGCSATGLPDVRALGLMKVGSAARVYCCQRWIVFHAA